jgi:hypothetical protein
VPFVLFASSWFHFPAHTLLAVSDAQGSSQGHLWYDPHGSVLTSTLPVTLTQRLLSSQGLDSRLGLVYHGDGRYYDPVIAHTLQPDPFGGVPQLPQSLNRYAAIPLGPSGVVQAANQGLNPLLTVAGKGALKTTISATAGQRLVAIAESQLPLVVAHRAAGMQLTLIMSRWARYRYFSSGAASPFEWGSVAMPGWGRSFRAYTVKGLVTEVEPGLFLTESGELVETGVLPKSAAVLTAEAFTPVNITRFIAGGSFAFLLSAGVQLWFDYPNPYLSGEQKSKRTALAGVGGLGAWGTGTVTTLALTWAGAGAWAGHIGMGVGFVAGFIWFGFAQPAIFEARGMSPKRNLAPLY